MRNLVRWLRLVCGLLLAMILLAAVQAAVTAGSGEPVLWKVMNLLSLLAFALLAAGWALGARWDGPGTVLRDGGLAVFGLAMAAYVVNALSLPDWLSWALFGLFASAAVAFPIWLFVGSGRSGLRVEPDGQGRLEVPVARATTLMLAVVAGFMATMAAVLLPIPVLGWVIGSVGVVFFGAASAWLALLVARPGPAIRADPGGLEDRSSLIAIGRVSWTELRRIRKTTTFGQTAIALSPHDWAAVVARQAGWRRPLLAFTRRLTGSDDLLVNSTALPCSAHELAEALEAMRRDNSPARGSE